MLLYAWPSPNTVDETREIYNIYYSHCFYYKFNGHDIYEKKYSMRNENIIVDFMKILIKQKLGSISSFCFLSIKEKHSKTWNKSRKKVTWNRSRETKYPLPLEPNNHYLEFY